MVIRFQAYGLLYLGIKEKEYLILNRIPDLPKGYFKRMLK